MANMDSKRVQRVTDVALPLLARGERLEMCSLATVSNVSRGKKAGAGGGVLTGGILMVGGRPRAYYVALTDRRLLLFGIDPMMTRKPDKHIGMQFPRPKLQALEPKTGLFTTTVVVEVADRPENLKLVFTRQMRDDATGLVTALNGTPKP